MVKIDKEEYQKRLDKLTKLLSDIVDHAGEQLTSRCPYKNSLDQCTAKFGCRNQRNPDTPGSELMCEGDDKLDYRSAWETEPFDRKIKDSGQRETGGLGTNSGQGQSRRPEVGKTIFDYADRLAVEIPTSCGRTGHCHECIVEIKEGMEALRPRTEAESFLQEDYRLACQAVVENADLDIKFSPLRRRPKILTLSQEKPIKLEPMVSRKGNTVYYEEKSIDKYRGRLFGLAIDLGTSTVVVELVDLESGASEQIASFENPQRFGGSDVMSRISYDGTHKGELRKAIVNALNQQILELSRRLKFSYQEIYEIVVAGNSTMRDIFFKVDVQSIGQKPYKSEIENEFLAKKRANTALSMNSRKLGLRANPKAIAYGMPLIASHVGADVAADLIAIDMESHQDVVMLLDVGTNTEVVLAGPDRVIAASCPAGPAFEGRGIRCGMPAYEGAIESIRWDNGRFEYETIGGTQPQGICGSGLIDLLAELRRSDQMTPKGVFRDRKQFELSVVPEQGITLSREDASNLAQAKAANYCGQFIVMREFGISPSDISRLYLAGGFANYVDVENAVEIGFLAPVSPDRVVKSGNAAVQGAREVLLSRTRRQAAEELVKRIEHVELETTPDFFEIFVEGCQFKPMPAS